MLLLTAAFFIDPPFFLLIDKWLPSFQYTSFPAITYNPFVYLTCAHRCPQTLTVWWRDFLCSMVEYIDYGQEATLSKVRHEHSVIKDRRRVHYCRTGCWCLQGHSHPHVLQLRPTPWRKQLEFHLRDLSFMSAEHDVKPGHSAGRSITKRHAVSNKLSRWDASVTHLISLPILHVHSSRRCSCSQLHSSLSLPSYNL